MASEWLETDRDGLYILARLRDNFWRFGGRHDVAAEIRQQEARFGLSPLDRRRLEWSIEPPTEDDTAGPTSDPDEVDPRVALRLVQ